jgi:hypothetical protein
MDQYKRRREMNGKRSADVFKGKDWNLAEPYHINVTRHESEIHPYRPDYKRKRGPDEGPIGGSKVPAKPKPKYPTGGAMATAKEMSK